MVGGGGGGVEQIKSFAFVNAYSMTLMLTTPFVMVMLTLVVYFNGGGDFSPDVVFTAVSLLLVIRFPLMMLPMAVASWIQAKVRAFFANAAGGGSRGRCHCRAWQKSHENISSHPYNSGTERVGFPPTKMYCWHQVRSAERCSVIHMKGVVPLKKAYEAGLSCVWMTASNY